MRRCCGCLLGLVLLGCAQRPAVPPQPTPAACEQQIEARGSARPLPGFPGLASSRFLASLLDDIPADDPAALGDWLARARALALHDGQPAAGRPVEDACTAWWRARLRADRAGQAALRHAARVESEYSTLQRVLGLYPLLVPGLKLGIAGYQSEFLQRWGRVQDAAALRGFATPAGPLDEPAQAARELQDSRRDALGVPQIGAALASRLARLFAPRFAVEVRGPADLPGTPRIAGRPGVDDGEAVLSWRLDFTRAHGRVLPQLSWVIWFDQRPEQGWPDWYAGPLDGLIWRATFGPDGWPVAYDTIHPCGCYHLVFPTRHPARDPGGGFFAEARLQPPAQLDQPRPTLLIESATHYLRGINTPLPPAAENGAEPLRLEAWARSRERLAAGMRDDGVIRGSERLERLWLWPSGVRSPGAMRDWGRQATAFVGQQHFDDPFALQPYLDPALFLPAR